MGVSVEFSAHALVALLLATCKPATTPSAAALPSDALRSKTAVETPLGRATATQTARVLSPQPPPWSEAPMFFGDFPRGPGLAARASPGTTLVMREADGDTWTRTVAWVDLEACVGTDFPSDECAFVALDDLDSSDAVRALPWTFAQGGAAPPWGDIALLPTYLAGLDAPPPSLVGLPFEVRYANALCESDDPDGNFVRMSLFSSGGIDPFATAPFLRRLADRPRRVMTLRLPNGVLHFVTVSDVLLPADRRMVSLPPRWTEHLWIVRESSDGSLAVLQSVRQQTGRGINHDYACMLPFKFALPFAAVDHAGAVAIYSRNMAGVERLIFDGERIWEDTRWPLGEMHELF